MDKPYGRPLAAHDTEKASPRVKNSLFRRVDGNVLEVVFARSAPAPQTMIGPAWYHEAAIALDEHNRAVRREWHPTLM